MYTGITNLFNIPLPFISFFIITDYRKSVYSKHVIIAVFDIPNYSIFRSLICSRKIWSRNVVEQTELGERGAGVRGKERKRVRKKEKRGAKGEERRTCFPEKKSSRERSRLGLPSWRNTRSSLILSFSLLSSAQLPTSSQLRTFTATAFQLVFPFLPFFSLSLSFSPSLSRIPGVRTCGRKAFSSVGLFSRISQLSRLPTTSIFDMHHYLLCLS